MEDEIKITKELALEDIRDWLLSCIDAQEADGYQSFEDEFWAKEPPLLTITDDGELHISYRSFEFTAKLRTVGKSKRSAGQWLNRHSALKPPLVREQTTSFPEPPTRK